MGRLKSEHGKVLMKHTEEFMERNELQGCQRRMTVFRHIKS